MNITVLLGAEGCVEVEGENWIKDATPEEIAAFKTQHNLTDERVRELMIDDTGRPYWWKTLLAHAPERARLRAMKYKRLRYLFD